MPTFNRSTRLFFIFLLQLCATSFLHATQQLEKFWSLYTLNGNYAEFLYHVEPQLRLVYRPIPFQQFLGNIAGGFSPSNHIQLWLGQTFSTNSQDATARSQEEYRLWEQMIWNGMFLGDALVSRTRMEQRKSLFFTQWAYRLRERLSLSHRLTDHLFLILSDEVFFNFNLPRWIRTKYFDQNRAYVGIEQQLEPNHFFGVGYMNEYLTFNPPQSNQVFVLNFRVNLFS